MSGTEFLPEAGDLIWTDSNPTRGREQAVRRWRSRRGRLS